MVRAEVELTDEEAAGLEKLANERKTSIPECIHEGVKLVLGVWGKRELCSEIAPDMDTLWERSLEVVGKYNSGIKDLAENHDKYLAEAYKK